MRAFLRVMASGLLLLAAFPMIVVFFGLFFYEAAFSVRQVGIQVGVQFLLFTLVYVAAMALKRLWREPRRHPA